MGVFAVVARAIASHFLSCGREIFDALDLVAGEQGFTQFADVQPFIRCPFDAPEVKIEAVQVNAGFHANLPENAEAGSLEPASRPATEATGEMMNVMHWQLLTPSMAKKA